MRGCAAHGGPAFVEGGAPFEPVGGILDGVVAAGFLAHDGHLVPRVRRHPGTQVQPDRRTVLASTMLSGPARCAQERGWVLTKFLWSTMLVWPSSGSSGLVQRIASGEVA